MKFLWPSIATMSEADRISRDGAGVSFFVAAATALITYLQINEMIDAFPHVDQSTYIKAILFAGIGCLLLRCSRIAAIAGFLLFTAEQIFLALNVETRGLSLVAVFIVLSYLNSIRATFRYHSFMKNYTRKEAAVSVSEALEPPLKDNPERKKKFPAALLPAAVILAAAFLFGAFLFVQREGKRDASNDLSFYDKGKNPDFSSFDETENAVETGEKIALKLKSGRTVSGKVKYEDEIYYTIQTMAGEEIVIKEDIVP